MSPKSYEYYPKLLLRTPAYSYTRYPATLEKILDDDYFRTAVFLASKSLYEVLNKKSFNADSLAEKVKLSLKMYWNKMCFRPTPFGLFSGFSIVSWRPGKETMASEACSKIHVQPDNFFLGKFAEQIPGSKNEKFTLNKSIYQVAGEYRYLRFTDTENGSERKFFISSFHVSPVDAGLLFWST